MQRARPLLGHLAMLCCFAFASDRTARAVDGLPTNLRVVLDNTTPLKFPRHGRLPLYVLPLSGSLSGIDDARAEAILLDLDERGIGYTVDWNPAQFAASLAESLRIGGMQQRLGLEVSVNANACLHSFYDGTARTLHVDDAGKRFAETSFGGELGCPFALDHRIPVMKERVASFLRGYRDAGMEVDFAFADWEVDGPIEWNDAWSSAKRCRSCRQEVPQIDDFRKFQKRIREMRSEMQRIVFADNVTSFFPEALVGNYAVYPHDGYRYWYDYFEVFADRTPFRQDQRARYREWYPEFELTGYTFAMPVVYTWYPTFAWYDFADSDYRWFYNMLLVGSNAGRCTPQNTPIVSFVHWTTTSPPEQLDASVEQFSEQKYQELLWHLLLRGHDAFFLWCVPDELAQEVRLVHEVYAAALEYRGFLDRGTPVAFDTPKESGTVLSGLRLGDRVLVRRTDFSGGGDDDVPLQLADGKTISAPPSPGIQVLDVTPSQKFGGSLVTEGANPRFPIGSYELPPTDAELNAMAQAGFNLVRCSSKNDLDRVHAAGLMGWVPLDVQQGATDVLREKVASLKDHPALAVWEGPDEIVWTFTAYSALAKSVGVTRADWENQTPKAVAHGRDRANAILPAMRAGIRLVKQTDDRNRPFWINEAVDSDVAYVRGYVDEIDVTGCDFYAVRAAGTDLPSIGRSVDRWRAIDRRKPVWMVLQAFSWHAAADGRPRLYPSFAQSRFMAYEAIVHQSRGLFYWGSNTIDEPLFRTSLYALTAELALLERFLVAPEHDATGVALIADVFDKPGLGVRASLRSDNGQWLLILVNEDAERHLGVDVTGLEALEGRELHLLYGNESIPVKQGGIVTRMQGFEVKVFSTDRALESPRRKGRDYEDRAP